MKCAYMNDRPLQTGTIRRLPVHQAVLLAASIPLLAATHSVDAAAVTLVALSDETLALDPVGSGCLDYHPDDYDTPFDGKLASAPFCVPEPCDAMLSRDRLGAWIMGRAPEDWEWDAYASRYAEACVAETGTPWPGEVGTDYPAIGPGDVYPSSRSAVFFPGEERGRGTGSARRTAGGGGKPGNSALPIGSVPPTGGSPGGGVEIPCLDNMDPNA
ncbi:MAG: hypothetical protein WBA25_15405, partial [Jannaschia sp.]